MGEWESEWEVARVSGRVARGRWESEWEGARVSGRVGE